jgi:HlyD family secretion protein
VNFSQAIKVIWRVLTPAQRRRFVVLQFVSMLMAVSTVVGLAAVIAILAVLADPSLIDSHVALSWAWQASGSTRRGFLLVLSGGLVGLLIVSAATNIFGSLAMGRFAYSAGDRVREVLFAGYLRRDYLFHARAGAARLMNDVINQADRVTSTLLNGQVLIANAVLTVLMVASIAVVNATVALAGVLAIAGSYFLLYQIIRKRVGRNGRLLSRFGAERISVVGQAFHGIKYLLVARAQDSFRQKFATVSQAMSHAAVDTQFIGQLPRYLLECMAGAALIACAVFISGASPGASWFAQLSFIGFAGFRLLPAFAQMYSAFVVVRANRTAIEHLASELSVGSTTPRHVELQRSSSQRDSFRCIELVGVSFRYSPEAPLVLKGASLRIDAGAAIGIVGASGCGKSTLLDLILGLLTPVDGRIDVDGAALDAQRLPRWQQAIGYVPQDVIILDASLSENIAFGVNDAAIDPARVREVAAQAGAGDFIEALPGGYAAKLSGSGGGLSGGQRQRIGIARALYHKPSLLVLDEATNSLDVDTERAIIDAVVRYRGACTILVVAHGAAATAACERVYELRGGTLQEHGLSARRRSVAE